MPFQRKFNESKTVVQKNTIARGYIYLIEAGDRYKIGYATSVESRIKQLNTGSPIPLTCVHSFEVNADDMSYIEKSLHKKFKEQSVHLEWFSLLNTDIAWFKMLDEKTVLPWLESMEKLKDEQSLWIKLIARITREIENITTDFSEIDIKYLVELKNMELSSAQIKLLDIEQQISECK